MLIPYNDSFYSTHFVLDIYTKQMHKSRVNRASMKKKYRTIKRKKEQEAQKENAKMIVMI